MQDDFTSPSAPSTARASMLRAHGIHHHHHHHHGPASPSGDGYLSTSGGHHSLSRGGPADPLASLLDEETDLTQTPPPMPPSPPSTPASGPGPGLGIGGPGAGPRMAGFRDIRSPSAQRNFPGASAAAGHGPGAPPLGSAPGARAEPYINSPDHAGMLFSGAGAGVGSPASPAAARRSFYSVPSSTPQGDDGSQAATGSPGSGPSAGGHPGSRSYSSGAGGATHQQRRPIGFSNLRFGSRGADAEASSSSSSASLAGTAPALGASRQPRPVPVAGGGGGSSRLAAAASADIPPQAPATAFFNRFNPTHLDPSAAGRRGGGVAADMDADSIPRRGPVLFSYDDDDEDDDSNTAKGGAGGRAHGGTGSRSGRGPDASASSGAILPWGPGPHFLRRSFSILTSQLHVFFHASRETILSAGYLLHPQSLLSATHGVTNVFTQLLGTFLAPFSKPQVTVQKKKEHLDRQRWAKRYKAINRDLFEESSQPPLLPESNALPPPMDFFSGPGPGSGFGSASGSSASGSRSGSRSVSRSGSLEHLSAEAAGHFYGSPTAGGGMGGPTASTIGIDQSLAHAAAYDPFGGSAFSHHPIAGLEQPSSPMGAGAGAGPSTPAAANRRRSTFGSPFHHHHQHHHHHHHHHGKEEDLLGSTGATATPRAGPSASSTSLPHYSASSPSLMTTPVQQHHRRSMSGSSAGSTEGGQFDLSPAPSSEAVVAYEQDPAIDLELDFLVMQLTANIRPASPVA